ncbi:MAG: sulfatase-like hydrolase/transferase, partial [Myxococcota bacterium]
GPGFENGFRTFRASQGHQYYLNSFALMQLISGGRPLDEYRRPERCRIFKEDGLSVLAALRRWLERSTWRPFFAYVHIVDPHWPYYERGFGLIDPELRQLDRRLSVYDLLHLPKRRRTNARLRQTPQLRELVARYDEEVRWADRVFGELRAALAELDLERRTLVVIVADHGEEFFEHDSFGHGHDVYEQLIHVPLAFLWPDDPRFDHMPRRIDEPVSLLDVLPTLSDYLDLPPPPSPIRGHSMRPLLEGTHDGAWFPVFSETLGPGASIGGYREGSLKVRLHYRDDDPPRETSRVQVFDLERDPFESSPLRADEPRVAALVQRAREAHHEVWNERWSRRLNRARKPARAPRNASERTRERLRALGYVE